VPDEADRLLRRIRLGEDSTLELKRVVVSGSRVSDPSRDAMSDELAAFANSRAPGGVVLLGVDDKSRDVLGIPIEQLDVVETWLRQICNDSIDPPLAASIRKLELPDRNGTLVPVIRVDVSRSLFVHQSAGGFYQRIGSSKRKLAVEALTRLLQERSQTRVIRFDESPVPRTSPGDLDMPRAARFLRAGTGATEADLRKLRLIVDDEEGVARLSVAGVLMATAEPQAWLPHAMIQAVAYRGQRTDVEYQLDARDIGGSLDDQVIEALHFVRRNMRIAATKTSGRRELPQWSERAVFEALVNAVAHRDYGMGGARIRLHLFADRLELYVPGALANTLTPDSLHLRQYSRNELVVSLLARCPMPGGDAAGRPFLMDRRGDGVPIIQDETLRLAGRPAEYTVIDDSELRLVLPSAGLDGVPVDGS
jgi:predicted HTH transcriptional regulator